MEQQADSVPCAPAPIRGLALAGTVGVAQAAELCTQARALADSGSDVRVQLAQAEHLDSAILQLLAALKAALVERGRSLQLVDTPAPVAAFIRTAGLGDVLLGPAS